jgi:hypothetical protein
LISDTLSPSKIKRDQWRLYGNALLASGKKIPAGIDAGGDFV